MVINTITVGEYDKRLTILTKEKGRIQAFARGAKRQGSLFSAVSNPFVFGRFYLRNGKNAYNLAKSEVTDYFEEMSSDLDKVYYGSYFLELADYYGVENQEATEQLNLIYMSLKALLSGNYKPELVRVIYELKTLVINGEYPQVFKCNICGTDENIKYFSSAKSGCICENCGPVAGSITLAESSLYTMQFIISSTIRELFSFKVTDSVLINLELIMKDYFKFYVDRKFRSLEFL